MKEEKIKLSLIFVVLVLFYFTFFHNPWSEFINQNKGISFILMIFFIIIYIKFFLKLENPDNLLITHFENLKNELSSLKETLEKEEQDKIFHKLDDIDKKLEKKEEEKIYTRMYSIDKKLETLNMEIKELQDDLKKDKTIDKKLDEIIQILKNQIKTG